MGKLISVSVWAKNSNAAYASASTNAVQEDRIKYVENVSTETKMKFPSASANINSRIILNWNDANEGTDSVWYVQDTVATIVSGS